MTIKNTQPLMMWPDTAPASTGLYTLTVSDRHFSNVCFSIAAKWDGKDWRDARFGVRLDLTNYKVSYTGPTPEAQKEVEPGRNG